MGGRKVDVGKILRDVKADVRYRVIAHTDDAVRERVNDWTMAIEIYT